MELQQAIDARWAFAAGVPSLPHRDLPAAVPAPRVSGGPAETAKRDNLAVLIARMTTRDERALAEFYDATAGKAFGVTLRIVRNPHLAEEVVADAYYQAWRDAGRYDQTRGGPLTWLLMICRSRALDALRARDIAIAHEDPEALRDPDDQPSDADPLDLLVAVESRTAVHAALMTLSPSQRQMIGLAFFQGLSHTEISERTELPLGTVKSQIRRALEALRRSLEVK